jgi:hypothetical protein
VVLRQLHLVGNGTWWQPWGRAPTIIAAVGAAYQGLNVLIESQAFEMADFSVSWSYDRLVDDGKRNRWFCGRSVGVARYPSARSTSSG